MSQTEIWWYRSEFIHNTKSFCNSPAMLLLLCYVCACVCACACVCVCVHACACACESNLSLLTRCRPVLICLLVQMPLFHGLWPDSNNNAATALTSNVSGACWFHILRTWCRDFRYSFWPHQVRQGMFTGCQFMLQRVAGEVDKSEKK